MHPDWGPMAKIWMAHGVATKIIWKHQPRRPGRVVVLWDVSGSMQDYLTLYAPWVYRLAQIYPKVGVFPFGVGWQDATRDMTRPFSHVWSVLAEQAGVWGAGTAIGSALLSWSDEAGARWMTGSSLIIIISDGWDVGPSEKLETALRQMRQRVGRLVWINPLMATRGFEVKTRSLKIVARYADLMVSGHNPQALMELVDRWYAGQAATV